LDGGRIYADAGVASPKVARFAAAHHFVDAEFLAGIPGTVGGALAMNAGCYGGETWDIVHKVVSIDRSGSIHEREKRDYEIAYRHCRLRSDMEEWFVGAWFELKKGDGEASRARIKELLARRIASQPLQLPNAGSVFRNPPGDHAARLIESCGLKGLARGGARVSEKHANFIVNPDGAASAADIESLILQVKKIVRERTGVELVPEVRIVGEPA
jgi:UDP-N-acetylmuramate dehydrogenase